MTSADMAFWLHEYNLACKKRQPKKYKGKKWICKDCFYIARQLMFSISLEFKEGLTEKHPDDIKGLFDD
jgi:hypothetical protein